MFDKKMAIFYILDILKEHSDENHILTQKDIIEKLKIEYNVEIERKTISSTIELLTEYGYDIVRGEGNKGYYLGERDFDETEIRFLIDAIYSSKAITGEQALKLSKKVYKGLSKYEQKDYSYLYKSTELNRTENKAMFANIDIITEAIKNRKKITFNYNQYNAKGELERVNKQYKRKVSPYFLVNNFNKYYLLSSSGKFKNHRYNRVEYMTDVEILDEDIRDYSEVETMGPNFDISKHINEHVYLFSGDTIHAKIEILPNEYGDINSTITYVLDWFGKNARVYEDDGKVYATIKSNKNAFIYWALQYQEYVKIISPSEVVDSFVEIITKSLERYK